MFAGKASGYRLTAAGSHPTNFGHPLTAVGYPPTIVGHLQTVEALTGTSSFLLVSGTVLLVGGTSWFASQGTPEYIIFCAQVQHIAPDTMNTPHSHPFLFWVLDNETADQVCAPSGCKCSERYSCNIRMQCSAMEAYACGQGCCIVVCL